jgi:hypothetical protein
MPIVRITELPRGKWMDLKRLTRGELSAGGAAIVLMIVSVIPLWGSVSFGGGQLGIGRSEIENDGSFNLWEEGVFSFLPRLAVLIGLVTLVLILVRAIVDTRAIPPVAYLALGVTATLLMLMGVAVGPTVDFVGLSSLGLEVQRGPLLYAGAVLCAAMTFGGWLHVQSRNTAGFDNRNAAPPPM